MKTERLTDLLEPLSLLNCCDWFLCGNPTPPDRCQWATGFCVRGVGGSRGFLSNQFENAHYRKRLFGPSRSNMLEAYARLMIGSIGLPC